MSLSLFANVSQLLLSKTQRFNPNLKFHINYSYSTNNLFQVTDSCIRWDAKTIAVVIFRTKMLGQNYNNISRIMETRTASRGNAALLLRLVTRVMPPNIASVKQVLS